MFDTSKAVRNRYDDLADKVLEGQTVTIYLRPNETQEDELGLGPYIEAVELPHIVVRDKMVWAGQQRNVAGVAGASLSHTAGYIYCNAIDMFLNYRISDEQLMLKSPNVSILLLSTAHYSELRWHCENDYELVWEDKPKQDKTKLVEAIHRGARFKVAIQDEKHFWNVHPVYYPFYYPEKDILEFHTHLGCFPNLVKETPKHLDTIWKQANGTYLDSTAPKATQQKVAATNSGFWLKYKVRDNGYYQTIEDQKNGRRRPYQRLKIFASRAFPSDTTPALAPPI